MKALNKTLATITAALLILLTGNKISATVYTTVSNGNWNSSSTWSPSKPNMTWGFQDTIIINHSINLTNNINLYGRMVVSQNGSLSSNTKYLTVKQNAVLENNGSITLKNFKADWGQTTVTNNGTITLKGKFTNYEGDFTNNGTLTVKSSFTNSWTGNFVNSVNGVIQLNDNLINYHIISNYGTITIAKKLYNKWSHKITNSGNIQISKDFINQGTFINSGNITSAKKFINDWSSTLNNSGNITVNNKIENRGSITNSGTITASMQFKNKSTITNSNTINANDDFYNDWSTNVNNTGVINVASDLDNYGSIVNDGGLIVDGTANSTSGTITGTGNLCNSDGVTDPTGGSKGVSCPICVGESGNLPVSIVAFDARNTGKTIEIHWATASEINNDYFEILRSNDGMNFSVIGTVSGNGNSNIMINYSFTDENPLNGNAYYILRQVDFDGTTSLSKMIEVKYSDALEAAIYPNPVTGGNNLTIRTNSKENKTIEIYSVTGSLVKQITSNNATVEINTFGLERGIYIVRIIRNNNILAKKIQVN